MASGQRSPIQQHLVGATQPRSHERFGAEFGVDIGLRQVGYLFLCRTDIELAAVESSAELQNSLGGSSEMVWAERSRSLNPFIDPSVLLGASFSPRDGHAQPGQVVHGYVDAARSLGVVFSRTTEVTAIDTDDERVTAVRTNRGLVRTDTVICAAGAWSQRIGEMAGVLLPVVPVRRQIGFTAPLMQPMPTVPFTLDLEAPCAFTTPETVCCGNPIRPESRLRAGVLVRVAAAFDKAAAVVAPSLVGVKLETGWAGLYENTPDHNALIGRARRPGTSCTRLDSPGTVSAGTRRGRVGHRLVPGTRLVHGPAPIQGRPVSRC